MLAKSADRERLVWMRWLPMSSVGAAIAFIIAFMMQLPPHQIITAAVLTGTLVFSGLAMRSYGKDEKSERIRA